MSIIQTSEFVIPSDPETIKQIKDACVELSASFSRVEAERDFVKEAVSQLSEDTEIPKKYLNKIARLYHRSNKESVEAENASTSELFDRIFDTANNKDQD